MLKAAGAAGAVIGTTTLATPASAADAPFTHPGLLHTRTDLDRMAAKVKAGAKPYAAGFTKLTANRHAQSGWRANPQATVYRGRGHPRTTRPSTTTSTPPTRTPCGTTSAERTRMPTPPWRS